MIKVYNQISEGKIIMSTLKVNNYVWQPRTAINKIVTFQIKHLEVYLQQVWWKGDKWFGQKAWRGYSESKK